MLASRNNVAPARASFPRITVAGLSGDNGKTLISIGLTRALVDRGLRVAPFKKGPDYIDASWLGLAARGQARNLDTFLMSPEALGEGMARGLPADVAVIEGNRGLFDGADASGTHSTAELAKRVGAPILLVVDVTKMTRTTAAIVKGCTDFDPSLRFAGVVLNQVATGRQERVIRDAIEASTDVPVLGAVPRQRTGLLPGRHLGLVTAIEHDDAEMAAATAASLVAAHVDVDTLLDRARALSDEIVLPRLPDTPRRGTFRIGVFRDEAFSFYYPENLESLEAAGAELVAISPLRDPGLADVDGLYVGGGFPEEHAPALAANDSMRASVAAAAADGLPIYAECGGLMYLAREIRGVRGTHAMAGVLDLVVEQTSRPQGHGYEIVTIDAGNPFYPNGAELSGHEFHYSRVVDGADAGRCVAAVTRGTGVANGREGIVRGHVWASYLHVHALGATAWAEGFLELVRERGSAGNGPAAAWG